MNTEVFIQQELDYPGSGSENSALTAGTGYLASGRGNSPAGEWRMELALASRKQWEKQETTDFATRSTRCHADQQKARGPDEKTEEAKHTQHTSTRNQHSHKNISNLKSSAWFFVIFELK